MQVGRDGNDSIPNRAVEVGTGVVCILETGRDIELKMMHGTGGPTLLVETFKCRREKDGQGRCNLGPKTTRSRAAATLVRSREAATLVPDVF